MRERDEWKLYMGRRQEGLLGIMTGTAVNMAIKMELCNSKPIPTLMYANETEIKVKVIGSRQLG